MSDAVHKILAEAQDLSPEERLQVAEQLLESLDREDPDDAEPREKVEKRLIQIEDGTAVLIPWKEAIENITLELERRKAARERGQGT